jgi:DNA-binding SARP family transcriptional activator
MRTTTLTVSAMGRLGLRRATLSLMGGFRLAVGGRAARVTDGNQRLLAFLALRGRPQLRNVVAGNIWPEKSQDRAIANLRSALWRMRVVSDVELVRAEGQTLCLADAVEIDVVALERLGWRLVADPCRVVGEITDRQFFYEELLPGWYEDWVILERERIGQMCLHFLEAIVDGLLACGRHADALDTALRLVAADPLRERGQLALIRAYFAQGSPHLALAQRVAYRNLLEDQLGCEPSPAFESAVEPLRIH